ncbi:MAG TPA: hypothetical protein ENO11_05250 [Desulfobacteraceae bacterium]|nr:hypothetical protein [Desulfobacteraceae bacterium]
MYAAHELALTSLVSIRPIQGWQEFLEAGNRYLRTAKGAYINRRKIFTAGILYNIIAMAVEKFVMAALMRHGTMPYNHTMADLVEAMEETFPGALADIREGLLHLDTYQDICDPWEFTIIEPTMDDIQAMLDLAEKLRELVRNDLAK